MMLVALYNCKILLSLFFVMNKFILSLAFLAVSSISSTALADCSINYAASSIITTEIKKRKFDFDGYDKLCARLKANNAGVMLTGMTQISPYQTTASLSIALYPVGEKYQGVTSNTDDWIRYEEERTSQAEVDTMYGLVMTALDKLSQPEKEAKLKSMLQEVIEMRRATK